MGENKEMREPKSTIFSIFESKLHWIQQDLLLSTRMQLSSLETTPWDLLPSKHAYTCLDTQKLYEDG